MKQIACIPAGALALAFTASLHAAPPPGNTQQRTSPDQVPDGLAKSDWQSIRAAYEAGRHAFAPVDGGWQARNPGQQWTTRFDGRGFVAEPREGGWQWGLELKSYGFPGVERVIGGVPVVKAGGQRLTYDWDAAVQEWFVNDARGLEHGLTVKERPAAALNCLRLSPLHSGSQPSTLNFLLGTRGTLRPRVSSDAQAVEFQDNSGASVLTYAGLKVWDADGKVLASRFEAAGENGVRLLVEEHGARYPLTIDPIAQQAYLKAHQVNSDTHFGDSVAVSGDTVVVGAWGEDSITTGVNNTPIETGDRNFNAGAAYVFVRNAGVWTQQAYLKPAVVGASQEGDAFGRSVAVSGDTVVVGAPNDTDDVAAGAAYVFVRMGTNWTQQAYLKAHYVNLGAFFGGSVAVSGDTVVVGAHGEDSSTTGVNSLPNESGYDAGAAFVFVRIGTAWTQQAYLKAHQVNEGDWFGSSVAVSGDTVVVGAPFEYSSTTGVNSTPNESARNAGAAYVFGRSGTTWTQQAYLKAHQVNEGDWFGNSVAVSGDTVVVGAPFEYSSTTGVNSTPNESARDAGAAYVFMRNGTNWTQQAYLKAHQVNEGDWFGNSVAVSGDTVVVGAAWEASSTTGSNSTPNELAEGAGAAYVFTGFGPSLDADGDGLLDSWELTYWPTIINHSPLDDFDGDGYVELLELALGLNPTIPNAGGLPPVTNEGGYLTITITKQPAVTYEVQSAGTLLNGQPDSFSPVSTSVLMNDATTLKVQDNILIGSAPGRFMRVKVTAAP